MPVVCRIANGHARRCINIRQSNALLSAPMRAIGVKRHSESDPVALRCVAGLVLQHGPGEFDVPVGLIPEGPVRSGCLV